MIFELIRNGFRCISFSIISAIVLYVLIEFTGFGDFWNSMIASWNTFSFFNRAIMLIFFSAIVYISIYVATLIAKDHRARFESMPMHVSQIKKNCTSTGGKWSKKTNQCNYKEN